MGLAGKAGHHGSPQGLGPHHALIRTGLDGGACGARGHTRQSRRITAPDLGAQQDHAQQVSAFFSECGGPPFSDAALAAPPAGNRSGRSFGIAGLLRRDGWEYLSGPRYPSTGGTSDRSPSRRTRPCRLPPAPPPPCSTRNTLSRPVMPRTGTGRDGAAAGVTGKDAGRPGTAMGEPGQPGRCHRPFRMPGTPTPMSCVGSFRKPTCRLRHRRIRSGRPCIWLMRFFRPGRSGLPAMRPGRTATGTVRCARAGAAMKTS